MVLPLVSLGLALFVGIMVQVRSRRQRGAPLLAPYGAFAWVLFGAVVVATHETFGVDWNTFWGGIATVFAVLIGFILFIAHID